MTIGILETEHFEGAYPVIRLFDTPGNKLVLFTNRTTYERFADLFKEDMQRYEWVVLDKQGSRFQYFQTIYRQAMRYGLDLLYFNTISNNHLLYAAVIARLVKHMRIVQTLHDINCMYDSRWSINPRKLAHHLGKRRLLQLVPAFNVVSDTMLPYLQQRSAGKKTIYNIPGAIYENRQQPGAIEGGIELAIPGTLDKKRRDYEEVFRLLALAEERSMPLKITLLGGYQDDYGRSIVQRAASIRNRFAKLDYYDTGLVLQEEFDRQLDRCHFIYIPSVIDTAICFDIPETYGITKSSGNIFDVIKHARPSIVPQQLTIPQSLESSCKKYDSLPGLLEFLQDLLNNKNQYQEWLQQAALNSIKFTPEKIRERNATLFAGHSD